MMRPSLVCSFLLAAGSLTAQFTAVDQSLARRMTRVVWSGLSGEQRLAIDYGQPEWRPEYETFMQAQTPQHVRLGVAAWTTLQSSVDLTFGDKKLPRGRWYLGVHRDATAAWSLTFVAADKLDAEGRDLGAAFAEGPDLSVPMRLERGAKAVDLLEIELKVDAKHPKNVALAIAWSSYSLHLDLVGEADDSVPEGAPTFAMTPKDKLITTASGLQYEVVRPGAGPFPGPSDRVTVHYSGWLTDGTPFDSSYYRGEPITFPLQAVVKGFAEGLQLMQPGATFQLTIPPALAYAERGAGGSVPPNSTLVFSVTLLEIVK